MISHPLVSIITPTWNMGKYLSDCIESVHNQRYPLIEHIIIDNLSTDNTETIVASYSAVYPRVSYIRERDSGQANAINKGLDLSTGEIVCWLNADDFYANDQVLPQVVSIFESMPDLDILCGSGYYVDDNKSYLRRIRLPRIKLLKYCDEILQPATFWRRNSIRLREEFHYVFDWIFFIEFLNSGKKFHLVDQELAVYRRSGTNKTSLDNAARRQEIVEVQKEFNSNARLNLWWCSTVKDVYDLLEAHRYPKWVKKAFWLIVYVVAKISRDRIVSG